MKFKKGTTFQCQANFDLMKKGDKCTIVGFLGDLKGKMNTYELEFGQGKNVHFRNGVGRRRQKRNIEKSLI